MTETKPKNMVDKQALHTDYQTPEVVLAPTRLYFPDGVIPVDPATAADNPTGALLYFTPEENGLVRSWASPGNQGVFLNPPYSTALPIWVEKMHGEADQAIPIIALLPGGSRTETYYWQAHVLNALLDVVCYIRTRLSFRRPDGTEGKQNTFGSALYGYNVDIERFVKVYGHLGRCVKMEALGPEPLTGAERRARKKLLAPSISSSSRQSAQVPPQQAEPETSAPQGAAVTSRSPSQRSSTQHEMAAAMEGFD